MQRDKLARTRGASIDSFTLACSSASSSTSPFLSLSSLNTPSKTQCWLEHSGRPLPSDTPLGESLLLLLEQEQEPRRCCFENNNASFPSVVSCRLRALGGGGDGGSTGAESRSSYLEMYAAAKPDALDPALAAATRATACALSGEPLRPPLVADALGSLFNKEAVLSGLVARTLPQALAHVSSIRHVFDARVTEIGKDEKEGRGKGAADGGESGGKERDSLAPRFCCPITGIHLNGRNKFLLLRPSGLVVSERAVRVAMPAVEEAVAEELLSRRKAASNGAAASAVALTSAAATDEGGEEKTKIETKVDLSAAIRLLPPLNELAAAREELLLERAAEAAARAEKKSKKSKKRKGEGEEDGEKQRSDGNGVIHSKKKSAEDEAAERKRRIAASTATLAPAGADKEVFASLFLSSKKGEEKESFGCRATGLGRR